MFGPNSTKSFPTPASAPSASSLRKPHPFMLPSMLLTYTTIQPHIWPDKLLECLTWRTLKQKTAASGWQYGIIKVHRYCICVSRHWICRVQQPLLRTLNRDLNPNGNYPNLYLVSTNHLTLSFVILRTLPLLFLHPLNWFQHLDGRCRKDQLEHSFIKQLYQPRPRNLRILIQLLP